MTMKKRDHKEIQRDILLAAREMTNKTKLVYGSYMNFSTINPYLDELVSRGLFRCSLDTKTILYETTSAGEAFLHAMDILERI
jgi:predicted transcriptional regulator